MAAVRRPRLAALVLLACTTLASGACARWHALNREPAAGESGAASSKWISDEAIGAVRVQIGDDGDRFAGERWSKVVRPSKPLAGGGQGYYADQVRFALLRFEPKPDEPEWAAEITYTGNGWADLDGTVFLLIDNATRAQLAGRGSEGNRSSVPGETWEQMTESERLVVPDSLVATLARAHSVEIRIEGASKVLDRWFDAEALASVRAMARKFGAIAP